MVSYRSGNAVLGLARPGAAVFAPIGAVWHIRFEPVFLSLSHAPIGRATVTKEHPMAPKNVSQHGKELGTIWYVIPLGWVAIAIASFLVLSNSSALPTELAAAQEDASVVSASASAAVHERSTEGSVPAASEVFTQRAYDPVEHVQAF
jgi:hypothetical protein